MLVFKLRRSEKLYAYLIDCKFDHENLIVILWACLNNKDSRLKLKKKMEY